MKLKKSMVAVFAATALFAAACGSDATTAVDAANEAVDSAAEVVDTVAEAVEEAVTETTVAGYHFLQEDSPHQIGAAIANWLPTI